MWDKISLYQVVIIIMVNQYLQCLDDVHYLLFFFSQVYTISPTPSCYMYVYLNQSDVQLVQLWDRYYNLTDRLLNETISRHRPLSPDKEEADLIRSSYEDVFEELRKKSLHELLDIPSDYEFHNKNASSTNWTSIRLQFETSMNRSMVRRLDTKTDWQERNLRIFRSFLNRKKKQFQRWFVPNQMNL